jgi:tetratricopeptide (TPR) repeat protein
LPGTDSEDHVKVVLILLASSFFALPAPAQHSLGNAPPAKLLPGLGNYHFPITTKSADAQKFFDQGLILLYGFNHDEAARAFRRAAELDPEAAMPWWGLALSIGPNYNDTEVSEERAKSTYDAVQKALTLSTKASAREQAYIRALALRYLPHPKSDWKKLHLAYSQAMREVVKQFPDDLDAAAFFAESLMMLRPWQLWTLDGQPAPGTLELVEVLESVLRRNPNHPGANHFYIHAVEASPNLERAIPSANRLMTLVPSAGHLVHMPGHIFLQTGDYDLAAKTNVNAARADKNYVEQTGITFGIYPLMYYTHNIHFVAYARSEQGRYEEAREAASQMVANVGGGADQMQMLEGFLLNPLFVELRFAKWQEILKAPDPPKNYFLHRAFRHYARGMAFVAQKKLREAEAERRLLDEVRRVTPREHKYLINNTADDFLGVAAAVLDARLAWARDERDKSVALWRLASQLYAGLQYDEPPAWYFPVPQSLGAALLMSGKPAQAEKIFREALAKKMRDPRLLFGLWQSLLAQKRADEAALVEKQFREAWKHATVKLRIEDL